MQVNLGDNRTQIGKKLTDQGYKWSENGMFITVDEVFKYNERTFDKAIFTIFDAKAVFSEVRKSFSNEEEAIKAFEEYEAEYDTKFSQFKSSKTNDACLKYSEYDDHTTIMSMMLIHKEKEEVPLLFQDAETLKAAEERWDISIIYNKSGMK